MIIHDQIKEMVRENLDQESLKEGYELYIEMHSLFAGKQSKSILMSISFVLIHMELATREAPSDLRSAMFEIIKAGMDLYDEAENMQVLQ